MRTLATWWLVIRELRRHYGLSATIGTILEAAAMILPAMLFRSRRVLPKEYVFRLSGCDACPLYHQPTATCGRPGDVGKNGQTKGCWCPVVVAAWPRGKQCWRAQYGEDQWS